MNKLYIMIGCPGSGKSTYVKNKVTNNLSKSVWVSRDTIRFRLVEENEEYFSKEKEVFKEFAKQINHFLSMDFNVYADATHLNPKSRAKLFNALDIDKNKTQVIGVVMRTPLEECIKRNEERKGSRAYVPINQVRRMYDSFKEPSFEEYNGIFDKIIEVKEEE